MARSMVGLRKGGSPVAPEIGDATDDVDSDTIGAAPSTGEPVVCPNCQCAFDPESGEIVAPPQGADTGGEAGAGGGGVPSDLLAQLAERMG